MVMAWIEVMARPRICQGGDGRSETEYYRVYYSDWWKRRRLSLVYREHSCLLITWNLHRRSTSESGTVKCKLQAPGRKPGGLV